MDKPLALRMAGFRSGLKALIEGSGLPANVMLDTVRYYCQNLERIAAQEIEMLQKQTEEGQHD